MMAGQDDQGGAGEGVTEGSSAEVGTPLAADTPQAAPLPDSDIDAIEAGTADWPLLPWILAALFALAGLAVHLAEYGYYHDGEAAWDGWRAALSAFAIFGTLATGLTLVRVRSVPSIIFSLIVGLVMAGIAYRAANAGEHYSDSFLWFAAAVLSTVLAVPLFQAGFVQQRFNTSYRLTHFYVWSDAICGAGALLFLGASWLLVNILAELFALIGIEFLKDLIDEPAFAWIFTGLAFGAALGVLRGQIKIIGTLQKVVMLVFSIMAVPLAVALALFLIALIFTGVGALWDTNLSATSVLLSCAAMSFVLVNAVMRDSDEDASQSRIMRIAAFILAIGIFPFAILAAISMGVRIGQHGLSPERIWAMCAILVAVCYGGAYLFAAIKGRKQGWGGLIRHSNLLLAVFTCVIALLLALPIFDFGAISTRNQLARLEAGKVSVEDFDYTALRWDFGDYGRETLAGMTKSKDGETAKLAKEAQESENRYYKNGNRSTSEKREDEKRQLANLRMDFDDAELQKRMKAELREEYWLCEKTCIAIETRREGDIVSVTLLEDSDYPSRAMKQFTFDVSPDEVTDGKEESADSGKVVAAGATEQNSEPKTKITPDSKVEIREWTGRHLYVDGKPIGEPFE